MPFNIPNSLTWARIALIPFFVGIYYLPPDVLPFSWSYWAASAVFALAAITDWFDGYLARSLGQTSAFGAFLDPVADKLMVAVALVLLVEEHSSLWLSLPAMIIIGREITISALREWMAKIGASKSVAVSMLGKIKTSAQMVAIPLLLYAAPLAGYDTLLVGEWLIWLAALLTLWSMGYYLRMAWPEIARRSAEN